MLLEDRTSPPQDQDFEHRRLTWCKQEWLAAHRETAVSGIEQQRAAGHPGRVDRLAASQQGLYARLQLFESEGFGEVVVGPQIQPAHPLRHIAACSQQENRYGLLAGAQILQYLQPVEA